MNGAQLLVLFSGVLAFAALALAFMGWRAGRNELVVERLLGRQEAVAVRPRSSHWLARQMRRAGIQRPRPWLFGAAVLALLLVWSGLGLFGTIGALGGLLLAALSCRVALGMLYQRRLKRMIRQMPRFLDQVVRSLHAGRTLGDALMQAVENAEEPLRDIFTLARNHVLLGIHLPEALQEVAELYEVEELRILALGVSVNHRYGGNTSDLLDSIVKLIHEREKLSRQLHAMTGETRISAYVLAGMTERMDDSFWVRRLQLMDSEARQLLQQAGWHESRYRTLYLISVFLTPLLFVLLVLLVKLLRAESEASYAVPLLFAAGIGFLLPKQVLKHFAKARRALIADEMILFVQLIRILFDAGLTVEQTLRVVCLEGRGITPQLARELDLALTRADNGIDLAEELEALARRLQVDPLNDCCGVLRQMLRQGGSARSTLLTLKQLFEDRRLTTLQERIGKLSAKMSLVMMVLLFPALLIVLAGPGVIAITKALGGLG